MVGAWDHARSILERLPQFAAVSHPAISKGLCKLIHTTIEPLYRRYVQVTLVKKKVNCVSEASGYSHVYQPSQNSSL